MSPMVTIQDIQREQENMIFDRIAIADRNKPIKEINCVSKTLDAPSNSFLMIYLYMIIFNVGFIVPTVLL